MSKQEKINKDPRPLVFGKYTWTELFERSKPITREDAIRRMKEMAEANKQSKDS